MRNNQDWVRPDLFARVMFGTDGDGKCCARCRFVYLPKADDRIAPTKWTCFKGFYPVSTLPASSCPSFAPNPNYG